MLLQFALLLKFVAVLSSKPKINHVYLNFTHSELFIENLPSNKMTVLAIDPKNSSNNNISLMTNLVPYSPISRLRKYYADIKIDEMHSFKENVDLVFFIDSSKSRMFYTVDFGANVLKFSYYVKKVSFCPNNAMKFLSFQEDSGKVEVFEDLVMKFVIHNVLEFEWNYDCTLYLVRGLNSFKYKLLKLNSDYKYTTIFEVPNIIYSFKQTWDFIYVTSEKNQLFVSRNTNSFNFRNTTIPDFADEIYVIAAEESQLLVVITKKENNVATHDLYITDSIGDRMRLSLKNILFFHSNYSQQQVFSYGSDEIESFADIHKVKSRPGTYIATQILSGSPSDVHSLKIQTVITFDGGKTWSEPNFNLSKIHCNELTEPKPKKCKVYFTQRFHQMLPYWGFNPILSPEYGARYVLATGVVGTGAVNYGPKNAHVFLSVDHGKNFHPVKRGFWYYALMNYGKIFVMVEQRSTVKELWYSYDECETYHVLAFTNEAVIVSKIVVSDDHNRNILYIYTRNSNASQWRIFTVDFNSVFDSPCDFYNLEPDPVCYLGNYSTYLTFIPHQTCYVPNNYVAVELADTRCECTKQDYECDFNFKYNPATGNCENDDIQSTTCNPGTIFSRTKGYRRIVGSLCSPVDDNFEPEQVYCASGVFGEVVYGWSSGNISMCKLESCENPLLLYTKSVGIVDVQLSLKLSLVAWIETSGAVYAIKSLNLTDSHMAVAKQLEKGDIKSFYLDSFNKLIWYTKGKSIFFARLDGSYRRNAYTIPDNMSSECALRHLTLDAEHGFVFFCITCDHTSLMRLSLPELKWKNISAFPSRFVETISLDWASGFPKVYVVSKLLLVYNYEGKLLYSRSNETLMNTISVHKQDAFIGKREHPTYSTLYTSSSITQQWNLFPLQNFKEEYVKVAKKSFEEHPGKNGCVDSNGGCTQLCLSVNGSVNCLCADLFIKNAFMCQCPNNEIQEGDVCLKKENMSCGSSQFDCGNGKCIPKKHHCDYDNDCGNWADEKACDYPECKNTQFRCKHSGKCIMSNWQCDFDKDCGFYHGGFDSSDEANCTYPECTDTQFRCANMRCVKNTWLCDGDDDCRDQSDERNCTIRIDDSDDVDCAGLRKCGDLCLPAEFWCDGYPDCTTGEDEVNCSGSCSGPFKFTCKEDDCIDFKDVCNGRNDCENGVDELSCNKLKPIYQHIIPLVFKCGNDSFECTKSHCIPIDWRCDNVQDCPNNKDEENCGSGGKNEFSCPTVMKACENNHQCVYPKWICDGRNDCSDGSDEFHCDFVTCNDNTFLCALDKKCIESDLFCDGKWDCPSGYDENSCHKNESTNIDNTFHCDQEHQFACKSRRSCISKSKVCNEVEDCSDASDEAQDLCSSDQITNFKLTVNEDDVTVEYIVSPNTVIVLRALNKESVALHDEWKEASSNCTKNKEKTKYICRIPFSTLTQPQRYQIAIQKNSYPIQYSRVFTTPVKKPSAPIITNVWLENGNMIIKFEHSDPTYYETFSVLIKDDDHLSHILSPTFNKKTCNIPFKVIGKTRFQLILVVSNKAGITYSDPYNVVFEDIIQDSPIVELHVYNDSINLSWNPVKNATSYLISYQLANRQIGITPINVTTKATSLLLDDLSPGQKYIVYVCGFNNRMHGPRYSFHLSSPGKPYSVPSIACENSTKDSISISVKSSSRNDLELFYGETYNQLINSPRINSKFQNKLILTSLQSFTEYMIAVGHVSGKKQGLLSNTITCLTAIDVSQPPRNLSCRRINSTAIRLSWSVPKSIGEQNFAILDRRTNERIPTTHNHAELQSPLQFNGNDCYEPEYSVKYENGNSAATTNCASAPDEIPGRINIVPRDGFFLLVWNKPNPMLGSAIFVKGVPEPDWPANAFKLEPEAAVFKLAVPSKTSASGFYVKMAFYYTDYGEAKCFGKFTEPSLIVMGNNAGFTASVNWFLISATVAFLLVLILTSACGIYNYNKRRTLEKLMFTPTFNRERGVAVLVKDHATLEPSGVSADYADDCYMEQARFQSCNDRDALVL